MTTRMRNDEAPAGAGASLNSLPAFFVKPGPCSGPLSSTGMLNRSKRLHCLAYAVDGCNVANLRNGVMAYELNRVVSDSPRNSDAIAELDQSGHMPADIEALRVLPVTRIAIGCAQE